MRRAPSRASSSRLGPTTAAAVVAIALRSGILCMGGVSFLAPRGRSRSLQPEGYAAFFMPPAHNLRVYLATYIATGLRFSEVLNLPFAGLDRISGEVRFIRAKGNRERQARLSPGALKFVKEYLRLRHTADGSDRLWLQADGRSLTY